MYSRIALVSSNCLLSAIDKLASCALIRSKESEVACWSSIGVELLWVSVEVGCVISCRGMLLGLCHVRLECSKIGLSGLEGVI
jgi:hypothetical protein